MKKEVLTICIITGSRAEYGLLLPLMKRIKQEKDLQLQIIATGMHLSPEFGLTFREIERDGFHINEKVENLISGDTDVAISKSTGIGIMGLAEALHRLQPDWVVLLGDRFETFAAATAAHLLKIPIAHLHGGELTEGATDDAFRHSITKMAYLHFTSTEDYRHRVIQLGEDPKRVFNTGAIGLDNIKELSLLSKSKLEAELEFENIEKSVLVTFHPVTMESNSSEKQVNELLAALDKFPETKVILTMPNADTDGRVIGKLLKDYAVAQNGRAKSFTSLGQLKYLSLLQYVKAVIGNSSSGIIEAPAFNIPTVNIGSRQDGRLKPETVIDTPPNRRQIAEAMKKAFSEAFRTTCRKSVNPYGKGNTSGEVLKQIRKFGKLNSTVKKFHDLPHA
ncbi:MAG TPA: UDP-N-acetylglucosamine 2-epimerase [Chitinophagaceae bacterium]